MRLLGAHADADAFFEDLQPASPAPTTPASAREGGGSPQHAHHHTHHHIAEPESGAAEEEIQRAMFVANYSGAVDLCLQVKLRGRYSIGFRV